MSDDYYDRLDAYRREDNLRDQIRRDYVRDDNIRQDYIDQDNRDWDNYLEDRDFREKEKAERHERFMKAFKEGDTFEVIHETAGPGAAADYLKSLELYDSSSSRRAADKHSEKAMRAFDSKDFETACSELTLALIYIPDHPALLFRRGKCFFRLKRYDEAIADFHKSLLRCSASREATVTFLRGVAYQRNRNLKNAEIDFNRVLALQPKHTGAYYFRGLCLIARKEFRKAIKDFTADLGINYGNGYSLYQRGHCYYKLGMHPEAIRDYKVAAKKLPDDAVLFNDMGLAHDAMRQLEAAIKDYTRAIRLKEAYPIYWSNRAYAHLRLGEIDKALHDYSEELKRNPKSWYAREGRGRCHERLREHEKAVQEFTEALKLQPQRASFHVDRAYNWFSLGNSQKALADCNEAVRLEPEYPQAYYMRARVRVAAARGTEAAMRDFDYAIKLKENLYLVHIYRAKLRAKRGDYKGALADFKREVQIFPDSGYAFLERGWFLKANDDSTAARKDFQTAMEIFKKRGNNRGMQLAHKALA